MHNPGHFGCAEFSHQVSVKVTEQKHGLKEHQTRRPDCSRTAKPWQNESCNDGLDLEQQKSAEKNSDGVADHRAMVNTFATCIKAAMRDADHDFAESEISLS